MPTFPSPSLKFRTVGFPSPAARPACQVRPVDPPRDEQKTSTPDLFPSVRPVCHHPSHAPALDRQTRHCVLAARERSACRCARGLAPLPQGSLAPAQVVLSRPSRLTTTPSVSPAGTRRFHGLAVYTPRLRCAGAPWRPTGPSLLSLPLVPGVPSTIRPWVRGAVPLRVRTSMPGFLALSPSRHPRDPAYASKTRRGFTISARHRSLYAAARLFASSS